jgi:hypothetical protein
VALALTSEPGRTAHPANGDERRTVDPKEREKGGFGSFAEVDRERREERQSRAARQAPSRNGAAAEPVTEPVVPEPAVEAGDIERKRK